MGKHLAVMAATNGQLRWQLNQTMLRVKDPEKSIAVRHRLCALCLQRPYAQCLPRGAVCAEHAPACQILLIVQRKTLHGVCEGASAATGASSLNASANSTFVWCRIYESRAGFHSSPPWARTMPVRAAHNMAPVSCSRVHMLLFRRHTCNLLVLRQLDLLVIHFAVTRAHPQMWLFTEKHVSFASLGCCACESMASWTSVPRAHLRECTSSKFACKLLCVCTTPRCCGHVDSSFFAPAFCFPSLDCVLGAYFRHFCSCAFRSSTRSGLK